MILPPAAASSALPVLRPSSPPYRYPGPPMPDAREVFALDVTGAFSLTRLYCYCNDIDAPFARVPPLPVPLILINLLVQGARSAGRDEQMLE